MRPLVTIIIPAWNEGSSIAATLKALRNVQSDKDQVLWDELIVVDDGSTDDTFNQAITWADKVVKHRSNMGKGAALDTGWKMAGGKIVVFIDADLGESAELIGDLLQPVTSGEADMTIACFPSSLKKGGFGLVKGLAIYGIYRLSNFKSNAPLSGQRAVRMEVLERIGQLSGGFGIEVGLTIDAAKAGYCIQEVPIAFMHRETERDWRGFIHRGKQFISVSRALLHKWRHPIC
ncbi:MAG TPA: glycosyltransferase family 2 protein [Bacilli bacterium]